ncbi:MAG: NosD domain-containing protein, partial [Euryarchaeota archaeon]|nr:NosD domain-containing protein [Euryarchaeota archaeon]
MDPNTENIKVNTPHLTIQSKNGSENCIIQAANPNDHVFEVIMDYVNISGFMVKCVETPSIAIYLHSADHCDISYNNIPNVNESYGIVLLNSSNNNIANNSCLNGIDLWWGSSNNIISNNEISNNEYGIYLIASSNNLIYLNNFINNNQCVSPHDSTNIWNSTSPMNYSYNGSQYTNYLGNYWDDYTDTDANGDGIGDTPYPIDSDEDNYPLMERFENYEIGPSLAESPWPMFQHDAQHTGRSPFIGPGIIENPEITRLIGGEDTNYFYTPVIGSDGTLYFVARINGKEGIYAFAPDGTEKWYYPSLLIYTGS